MCVYLVFVLWESDILLRNVFIDENAYKILIEEKGMHLRVEVVEPTIVDLVLTRE